MMEKIIGAFTFRKEVYQEVREGEEVKGKIDKSEIEYFIKIIKTYLSEIEN